MMVENQTLEFGYKSTKLFVEGHFEISFAVFLKIKSQLTESPDWKEKFFSSSSDIVDSVLAYISLLLIIIAIIYPLNILRNHTGMTERHLIMKRNSLYFENLKSKGNCGYFQVQYMQMRLLTVLVLVFMEDWPMF